MGFETERFVESTVDKELVLCAVCHDVYDHPVELPDCQHVFCTTCLKLWFDTGIKVCPLDRIPVVSKVLQPNRTLQVVLDRLRIRCEFASLGCKDEIPMARLANHQRYCTFNPRPDTTKRTSEDRIANVRHTEERQFHRHPERRQERASTPSEPAGQRHATRQDEDNSGLWILVFGVLVFVFFSLLRR